VRAVSWTRRLYPTAQVPRECMGLDYLAHHRALATAYRLLEDFGVLRLGDCVIQNAPETAVSQLIPSSCSEFVRMTGA
jgi:hypothetical protein